jgi:hypothetical protein
MGFMSLPSKEEQLRDDLKVVVSRQTLVGSQTLSPAPYLGAYGIAAKKATIRPAEGAHDSNGLHEAIELESFI